MSTVERTVVTDSVEATEGVAESLAAGLVPGDRILLIGDLGAGKTAFVRGLAAGLGHPDVREVVSPTFAIHNRYPGGRLVLDHVDLYRLAAPVDLRREGLDMVLDDPTTVLCIEWPERLAGSVAGLALEVAIGILTPTKRQLRCVAAEHAARRLFSGTH